MPNQTPPAIADELKQRAAANRAIHYPPSSLASYRPQGQDAQRISDFVNNAPEYQPPQRENPKTKKVDPTQAYINSYMTMHAGDVTEAWKHSMQDRLDKPNDIHLRNAEHALYGQHFLKTNGPEAKALLAVEVPGYTAYKQLTKPASADPNPMDEMKWGLKPLAGNINKSFADESQ